MTGALISGLSWLREPVDFTASCKQLLTSEDDLGVRLRALATHSLTEPQLKRLASVIAELRARGHSLAPLTPFKLGVIGNGTLDLIAPALIGTAARHGVALECVSTDYGQFVQEALSADSRINRAGCDAVLVALDYRGLPLQPSVGDQEAAAASVARSIELLNTVRGSVRKNSGALCILQTLAPPVETLFGNMDRTAPGSARNLVERFNRELADGLRDTRDVLLDVAAIAETVGLAEWHSQTQWNMAKLPFASAFLPLYADHVGRILGALCGKSRRCLILDLDNTLWGGVIGDDGLEGIVLGEGDGTGEAFLGVQRLALSLRQRGVVLAVSSKNDDATARRVFQEHPEMVLRENHIAVFQANWNDKATNIRAIAEELALGLDSMVFLDDNPAERALVRQFLPEVAVPELPEDPALYARTLAAAGYFEAVVFSDEDRSRADFYQDNARRTTLQEKVGSVDDFLQALDMEITFQPFDATSRSRITQLINKSNQFNLTTRRYTEAQVEALERDPAVFTLQVRLRDVFGDNGMICVAVCRARQKAVWEIDTWLMSCRVLGRGVERMVLRELQHHAGLHGVRQLIGVYRPTDRNGMVRDHYAQLGFTATSMLADSESEWTFSVDADIAGAPMLVRRLDFMAEAE